MRKLLQVLLCSAIIFTNCNKTTDGPGTVDPNKNEMVGYITVAGRDVRYLPHVEAMQPASRAQ
jgi:hypothetical protein